MKLKRDKNRGVFRVLLKYKSLLLLFFFFLANYLKGHSRAQFTLDRFLCTKFFCPIFFTAEDGFRETICTRWALGEHRGAEKTRGGLWQPWGWRWQVEGCFLWTSWRPWEDGAESLAGCFSDRLLEERHVIPRRSVIQAENWDQCTQDTWWAGLLAAVKLNCLHLIFVVFNSSFS